MAAPRLARMARQLPLRPDGTLRLAVVAEQGIAGAGNRLFLAAPIRHGAVLTWFGAIPQIAM